MTVFVGVQLFRHGLVESFSLIWVFALQTLHQDIQRRLNELVY